MEQPRRRDVLLGGSAVAGMALVQGGAIARTGSASERLIPWIDQPAQVPPTAKGVKALTRGEDLESWITPNDKFFCIAHYDVPTIDDKAWRLEVAGLVAKPLTYTLNELKALPQREVTSTVECAGNNGLPFLTSAIGNARWSGASLTEILKSAQIKSNAIEVVFFGADQGEEALRKGTPLELKFTGNFARSMSIEDAMNPANLLCYEMNGLPLPIPNGFPVRLITPGWFGVANVKWLRRIELRNTRFEGRFMGRDYVTVREERHDGDTMVVEKSVGRLLLKSAPFRVTEHNGRYRISGMAWGPVRIAAVEVKINGEPWKKAELDGTEKSEFAWHSWYLDWTPTPGEYTVTSRATDQAGNIQPAPDEAPIANKRTYWESNGQITRHIRIT